MTTLSIRRVWIEKAECTGHTLCVPEAPGLIRYDRDSDASVIEGVPSMRTRQQLQQLLEASFVCPMSAFYLETTDGHTYCLSNELIEQAIRRGDYRWAEPAA